jgi:methyl-accepting chemotaxis protein
MREALDQQYETRARTRGRGGFRHLSLKAKLLTMAGTLIAATWACGIFFFITLSAVKIGGPLYDSVMNAGILSSDFATPDAALLPGAFRLSQLMLARGQDDLQKRITQFETAKAVFERRRQYWAEHAPGGRTDSLIDQAFASAEDYYVISEKEVIPSMMASDFEGANHICITKLMPLVAANEAAVQELVKLAHQKIDAMGHEAASEVVWRIGMNLLLLTFCSVIGLWMSWFVASRIAMGLHEKIAALGEVAAGDFTQRLETDRGDELGQLALAINQMSTSLARMRDQIRVKAETLTSASAALTTTSRQLTKSSQQVASQASAASAAAEQISQSSGTISTATEEMTASVNEIAANAATAVDVAGSAAHLANTTNQSMMQLDVSSAEIGNVVKLITSIAEQTNLLALNAAIEAARAGDAGKGFAVVANEVKELAKETAKATEDISLKIQAIQRDARSAVGAINEITSVIGRISDIQNTIASSVAEQTATTSEIAHNISETFAASSEIAKNVTGVAQGAQETEAAAARAQQSADELTNLAESLLEMLGGFKPAESSTDGENQNTLPTRGAAKPAAVVDEVRPARIAA